MTATTPSSARKAGGSPAAALIGPLRSALGGHPEVHAWTMQATRVRSHEVYLARQESDAQRTVDDEFVEATLYTRAGDRMGSARLRLGRGEGELASRRVEEALRLAAAGAMEGFPLPTPGRLPKVELVDEAIRTSPARTLGELRERLRAAVAAEPAVQLASAEFFLHHDEARFESSTGVVADRSGTRTAAEVVLLSRGEKAREAEMQDLRYRRRIEDLDLEGWVHALAQWARDAASAEPSPSWNGTVILPGDSLVSFLSPVVEQASAAAAYQKGPHLEIDQFVGRGNARGDALHLASDATIPYGNASYVCDADGVPGGVVDLVQYGFLRRRWAEQRFAHYGGTRATGAFGNLVVGAGSRYERDLRDEGNVLEVMQFSWLNPNRTTGDFSSEVRFGYLSRGMARVPIHGGLLAGNVFDALADCHWSREQGFFGDSFVPLASRIGRLELSGR